MEQPFIGITTYGQDMERKFPLPREYVDSVRRAGGIPVLIPPGESHVERLLSSCDGLVLAGGGDVDPRRYHGQQHDKIYMIDEERDATEFAIARHAINATLPTLAICRGMQLVNVSLGGTLIEHLPDEVGEEILHRVPPRDPVEHEISVVAGSRLAEILGEREFVAASWHHQAVRDVADGLTVVAHAPDGIIEAVEIPDHPWLIAVQWHPEITAAEDSVQQRLFAELVQQTRSRRRRP